MLSIDLRPVNIACSSSVVKTLVSRLKPSIIEMPPPLPCVVTIGMPARQISSMSRFIVRRDTSNFLPDKEP